MTVARVEFSNLVWLDCSASRALHLLSAFVVVVCAVSVDRAYLLDQSEYLEYFAQAAPAFWFDRLFGDQVGTGHALANVFTEEILWRLWTAGCSYFFDPQGAVLATVAIVTGMVAFACGRLRQPNLAILLWCLLPVGLATIGLIQLRQGVGFAVLLYVSLVHRRPTIAALLAAAIHTTFVVAFVFSLVATTLGRQRVLVLVAATAIALAGALVGGAVFEVVGGRRLAVYAASEGASSINYVITGLICILPSIELMLARPVGEESQSDSAIRNLATIHVGITLFTVFSFFVFPLGTARIGYMTQLLLIPVLCNGRRLVGMRLVLVSVVWLYLLYLIGKSAAVGTYSSLLQLFG